MTRHPLLIGLTALAGAGLLAAAGYALYATGMQQGMAMGPAAGVTQDLPQSIAQGEAATRRHIASGLKAGEIDPATGKKILYYHDPMMPGQKFDKPAKSPFMDMMLVPVYADSGGDDGSKVTVSPRLQQNLGVRSAKVVLGSLSPQISAVGSIAWNERDQALVQARATGYVERLRVRATLDRVAKGQALAELYLPEWLAAQEEFLALRRMPGSGLAVLVDGARQRMRQAGMDEALITRLESSGQAEPRVTLVAPMAGVLTELLAREGMTAMAGATLFRINGTATVWAHAEVPESQAAGLRPGASVQATSAALPGTRFTGRLQALLPEINASTRTQKARLELSNPDGRLVPGMFVQMQFTEPGAGQVLLVPTEAILQTGRRTVVLLAEGQGGFRPVEVEIGLEVAGQTEVRRGLRVGQQVVVSSQFLIDSEASLKGVEARLNAGPASQPAGRDSSASKP